MTDGSPIRVMIVDDSAVIRGLVARILEAEPDIRVTASVANGRTATELLRHRKVDVVLLDIEMPEMDGLTALPILLREDPGLPVIMNSSLTQRGAEVAMRALSLGAVDYIPKPSAVSAVTGMAAIARELVEKVRAHGRRRTGAPALEARPAVSGASADLSARRALPEVHEAPRVLAIASSTGGPNALAEMLAYLPRDFPLPILIVQHMPPIFTAALAERLQRTVGRPCAEAREGDVVQDGHTYVAPGGWHMTVASTERQTVLHLDQTEPLNFCRPAADRTFRSVASTYGGAVLAAVLTGMGEDGLRGCEEIARRGGRILVQDSVTSVVWGMPGAVHRAGLAEVALPLQRLAERIQEICCAGVAQ